MTGIVHSTVATLPDEDGAEVNKAEWNADHAVTGDVNFGGFSILNAVIAGSLVTGLGTMSTQNANAVAITGGTATGLISLSVVAGTLTTDVKPFSQTLTWNNAAVAFTAWDLVITDTASAATSLLLRIRGGSAGTTEFLALNKSGNLGIGTTTPEAKLTIRNNFGSNLVVGRSFSNDAVLSLQGYYPTVGFNYYNDTTSNLYAASDAAFLIQQTIGGARLGIFTAPTGTAGNTVTFTERVSIDTAGKMGIGITGPTAILHLKAGMATANTAPLKLTSGALNTTAEVGAIEFLTDAYYATITTGAARKTFAFLESPTFTGTVTIPTLVSTAKIRLKGYTVATLPAGTQGDTAFVTDAAAPAFLAAIAGGGAVVTPVFYDGANWVGF